MAVIPAAIIPIANTDESGAFLLTLVPSRSYRTAAGPIDQPAAIPALIPVPDSTPDSAPGLAIPVNDLCDLLINLPTPS